MRAAVVLFALRRESAPFVARLGERTILKGGPCAAWTGAGPSGQLLILETGVGAERTRRALDWLARTEASQMASTSVGTAPRVIAAGFCGALAPSLRVGDVIDATEVIDEEGRRFLTEPSPADRTVRLATVRHLVADPTDKSRLCDLLQVQAVDMESIHVAHWCAERGSPFRCIRAVSDEASSALSPHLVRLLAGGQVAPGKLATTLLCRPWLVPQLWRLGRHTRLAARNLAERLWRALSG